MKALSLFISGIARIETEMKKDKPDFNAVASAMELAFNDEDMAIKLDPNFAEAYYARGLTTLLIFQHFNMLVDEGLFDGDFRKVLELSTDPELRKFAEDGISQYELLLNQSSRQRCAQQPRPSWFFCNESP